MSNIISWKTQGEYHGKV